MSDRSVQKAPTSETAISSSTSCNNGRSSTADRSDNGGRTASTDVLSLREKLEKLSVEQINSILQKSWFKLLQQLEASNNLLDYLFTDNILDREKLEEVQAGRTNSQRVSILLNHLRRGPKKWFLAFTNILFRVNQGHVASIFIQELRTLQNCVDVLRRQYKEYYKRLSEFECEEDNISMTIDLQKTFTNLVIRVNRGRIPDANEGPCMNIDDILEEGDRNVFLEGDPGQGKSCLILHILQFWQETSDLNKVEKNPKLGAFLSTIQLAIYITHEDYRGSLCATVWAALGNHATGDVREAAYLFWLANRPKCALFFDSIDEAAGDRGLTEELFDETKKGEMLMIMGVRTGHRVLQRLKRAPHKSIVVMGFSKRSIIDYTTKYFSGGDFWQQGNMLRELVSEDKHVLGLLHNPLTLYLTCFLIVKDNFEVMSLPYKTILAIFSDIENLFLRREGSLRNEEELSRFHKFALYNLLNEERPYFFEGDLRDFGIKSSIRDLPFVVQRKRGDPRQLNKGPALTWLHRSFLEYLAAKAVEEMPERQKKQLFMYMTAERMYSDVTRFMMSFLSDGFDVYESLTRITLALQANMQNLITADCQTCLAHRKLKSRVLKTAFESLLQEGQNEPGIMEDGSVEPCEKCLRLSGYLATEDGQNVLHNALQCVFSAPKQSQSEIFQQVIGKFLPTKEVIDLDGNMKALFPVSNADRLMAFSSKEESTEVFLQASCLDDITASPLPATVSGKRVESLWLSLDPQEVSLFSLFPPQPHPSKFKWCAFFHKISTKRNRIRSLSLILPINTPLYPLLEALGEEGDGLTQNGPKKIEVWYGEVLLSDWNEWFRCFAKSADKLTRMTGVKFCSTRIISSDSERKVRNADYLYLPMIEAKGIIQVTRI